jgi:ABC-2 type transport system permease protein
VTAQVRAELLKQRSVPTTLYLLLAMVGLVGLAVALHLVALSPERLASHDNQLDVFEVGTKVGMIFAGLIGAIAFTGEIRHGTIRQTLLVAPRRSPVVRAKLVVSALFGCAVGLLAQGLMAAAASTAFAARGIDIHLTGGDYLQLLLGGTAAAGLWALIGLGVGALVRDQTATLAGILIWMLLVENLLQGFVPGFSRFLPGATGSILAGNTNGLSAATATALLGLYAATAGAVGWLSTLRRDVP